MKTIGTVSGNCTELEACPASAEPESSPRAMTNQSDSTIKWNYLWEVVYFLL